MAVTGSGARTTVIRWHLGGTLKDWGTEELNQVTALGSESRAGQQVTGVQWECTRGQEAAGAPRAGVRA